MSAGSDFVSMLIEMGFSKEKAEKGLSMTGHKGVEAAMEWIFNHPELDCGTSDAGSSSQNSNTVDSEKAENAIIAQVSKSLKCDECEKLFKTQLEVEFHASKSGHSKFSESTEEKKPLTDEEKQEQLKKIEEKLRERRKEREEKEKAEALLKEKVRIKSGKELVEAKKKMEELEMKKIIEQRKREKEEDRLARQRVKDLIEADRKARRGISADSDQAKLVNEPKTDPILSPVASKEYTHTKIQIRLTNGAALTETFSVKEQLAAVRLYIEMNRTDCEGPFTLMTNFPKKMFTEEEYDKTLEELKLIPTDRKSVV